MCNLTSEAWIFWHLFFTRGTAAVIAFEGSLIHLRRTLCLPRVGNMIGIWHMSSFHLLSCWSSLCGCVCLFGGGGAHCFPVWSAAAGRQIDFRDGLVSVVPFFFFWRLICSSCAAVTSVWQRFFVCLFFLQRFKSWKSVMMKGPFKEAQVGWEQWQSERQIQRKELTS